MESDSNPLAARPALFFTEKELELAHQLAAGGIGWKPMAGMVIFDDNNRFGVRSPLQDHVYVMLDLDLFARLAGGMEKLQTEWTWLLSWEEGRAWLLEHGVNGAEVLDRIRERINDTGVSDREALYEIMLRNLRGAAPA